MKPPALPAAVSSALERFQIALRSRFGSRLRELTLFGSQARGDAGPESDVDLLVVIDDLTERERQEVFDLAWEADAAGEELVLLAPIPYSSEHAADLRRRERRLVLDADREGVRL